MTKKTIAKGEGIYKGESEGVKIILSEAKRLIDLELWLDIRSKSELFDIISIKINFEDSSNEDLTLTTPSLQSKFGFTNDTQELRIPMHYFSAEKMVPENEKDELITSLEIQFDTKGFAEFYCRIKEC